MRLGLPRSTFGLVTLASIVLCMMTLVLGVAVYAVSHEALEEQLDHRIATESRMLVNIGKDGGVDALIEAIHHRGDGHRASQLGYLLVDARGRRLAGQLDAQVPAPGWHEFLTYADPQDGEPGIAQALITQMDGGERLVVAADRTVIDEIDLTILRLFALTFGVMLIVGVGGAWVLGTVIRRRLDRINSTAQAIIDGDVAKRMARDDSGSEFDDLAETLNRMLDRNAELIENLRQVSSDIAHDLRTPLSRQIQVLENALANAHDSDSYRRAIETAAENGREILELFAALLRISEIETFSVRAAFKTVDLAEIVERVADAFRPDAEASGHPLHVDARGSFPVNGDRHLLSQMLVNLIENAIRHTPAGSAIAISLVDLDGSVRLRVADQGPGIAPEDRDHVLSRFSRLERSRSTPGYGLGLSLVAAVARAHVAALTLDGNGEGLIVDLTFSAGRFRPAG